MVIQECSIPGCERKAYRLELCRRHHYRVIMHGGPLAGEPLRNTAHQATCSLPGCNRPYVGKGLCGVHYQREAAHGDPLYQPVFAKDEPCQVRGCTALQRTKGYCPKHYLRFLHHGDATVSLRTSHYGEGVISRKGYRIISRPQHPNANKHGKLPEHRFVMAQMLGRPLLTTEVVHHKNGNRLDNRPANLELWVKSQPCGQRVVDVLAWARTILAQYASLDTNPYFDTAHRQRKGTLEPPSLSQLVLEGIA